MRAWTRRDLTIVSGMGRDCLVIACDSCGAVGLKDADVFRIPPRTAARFTARVALTEVLCSGALPVAVANGAACEMKPTGEETILGIRDELDIAGIPDIVLTGSTEENFSTSMTAFAITVIGTAPETDLKFGQAAAGDKFILFGSPRVGAEVDLESEGFYPAISKLLPMREVREIVPVGSKGTAYEAETLAALNGAAFQPYRTASDYRKSAGPATCLLVLCAASAADQVLAAGLAGTLIGELR
jgi:hypothetical protein